jgi:hypothetical protein
MSGKNFIKLSRKIDNITSRYFALASRIQKLDLNRVNKAYAVMVLNIKCADEIANEINNDKSWRVEAAGALVNISPDIEVNIEEIEESIAEVLLEEEINIGSSSSPLTAPFRIGNVTISQNKKNNDKFWLQHAQGEAAQISKEDLEKAFDDMFWEIF